MERKPLSRPSRVDALDMASRLSSVALLVILAGCLGPASEGSTNSPGPTSSPTTSPDAPAEIYNETVPYRLDGPSSPPALSVNGNWTTLTFRTEIIVTTCGQINNDPDGSAPSVVFTSPTGRSIKNNVPAGGTCMVASQGSRIGVTQNPGESERGSWTVTMKGRGEGASVQIVVRAV
jgi:hypothetical protein